MASVTLTDVRKVYHGGVEAVRGVSFEVADGSFCVLVGPSGCGKSTLLRMVAGLETISAGTVRIGERVVNAIEPSERDIAMVFQNYALYPHMSVYDNMAYGLRNRGTPKAEIDARVREAARILDVEPYLERRPKALSGGQRQRVAMGRAIVRKPQVFLFDEPLSNLDAKLRVQMRVEIKRLQRALGVTSIYVTHDQVEAMTLSDQLGRDERRPGGADRHADRPLPQAGNAVRRRVPRLAGDELPVRPDGERGRRRDRRATDRAWRRPARHSAGALVEVGLRPEDLALPKEPRLSSPWRWSSSRSSAPPASSMAARRVDR
jgi:sn-glycerol 3-phosphate transport system ATP-binding protein